MIPLAGPIRSGVPPQTVWRGSVGAQTAPNWYGPALMV